MRQLLIPLAEGATVVIANEEQIHDPLLLFKLIKEKNITLMDMVPSVWRACIQRLEGLPEEERATLLDNSLRRIVSVGEALMADLPNTWTFRFGHKAQLVNIFGQSETTGVVATYPIPADKPLPNGMVPIGRPIPETKIYILDAELKPVPVGVQGELCVSNPCQGSGYLHHPELTAAKFIPNPFDDGLSSVLYRTGDRAVLREDGCIEYLGRSDSQVKIRGQRVELSEIEIVMREHAQVRDCAVKAWGDNPDQKYLAAYIVSASAELTPADIREFVRSRLPEFMVPSAYLFLEAMPVTPNGKLNRLALPDPARGRAAEPSGVVSAQPSNPTEEALAKIWGDILERSQVGVQDNFFDLGGHSLSVVELLSRIESEFGARLPIMAIVQAPTIRQQANKLRGLEKEGPAGDLVPFQTEGHQPPFFCVHGVGGGVLGYRDLVNAIDKDQPFYGIQAVGLENEQASDGSIEDMAARYVEEIQTVQPHGPYRLGGYCFGGVVAYEMARQLEKQGEQVSLLAMFEAFSPNLKPTQVSFPQRMSTFLRQIGDWVQDYASMSPEELRFRARTTCIKALNKLHLRQDLEKQVRLEGILDTDLSNVPDRNAELALSHSGAFHRYVPEEYGGNVTLFRARNRSFNEVVFGSLDPMMGWETKVKGEVEARLVDGSHRNIHLAPYVKSLGAELEAALDMNHQNGRQLAH
jgi:thioesterase domain-containing protein/acyl carrier protein